MCQPSITDWIQAASAALLVILTLMFLRRYTEAALQQAGDTRELSRTAQLQIEEAQRPVLVVTDKGANGYWIRNVGTATALNVRWESKRVGGIEKKQSLDYLAVDGQADVHLNAEDLVLMHRKAIEAAYDSPSGMPYASKFSIGSYGLALTTGLRRLNEPYSPHSVPTSKMFGPGKL